MFSQKFHNRRMRGRCYLTGFYFDNYITFRIELSTSMSVFCAHTVDQVKGGGGGVVYVIIPISLELTSPPGF